MKIKNQLFVTGLSLMFGAWLVTGTASAGEITYTPVNPNFGGNPFNAAPLLSSAAAQDDFDDPDTVTRAGSTGRTFADRVDSLVLSQLARAALGKITDADGNLIPNSTIDTGLSTITVTEIDGGANLEVVVVDNATGEYTKITVPNI